MIRSVGSRVSRFGTEAFAVTTALVSLRPRLQQSLPGHGRARPRADFLAQLIAASQQVPQTRPRRRVAPQEAIAAYAARGRPLSVAGRALARSL